MKEQLAIFRTRIHELEKENIQHTKENYILSSELDYDNVKISQMQKRSDKLTLELKARNLVDRSQYDRTVADYEEQVE